MQGNITSFVHFRKVVTNFSGFEKPQIMAMHVRCVVFYQEKDYLTSSHFSDWPGKASKGR